MQIQYTRCSPCLLLACYFVGTTAEQLDWFDSAASVHFSARATHARCTVLKQSQLFSDLSSKLSASQWKLRGGSKLNARVGRTHSPSIISSLATCCHLASPPERWSDPVRCAIPTYWLVHKTNLILTTQPSEPKPHFLSFTTHRGLSSLA